MQMMMDRMRPVPVTRKQATGPAPTTTTTAAAPCKVVARKKPGGQLRVGLIGTAAGLRMTSHAELAQVADDAIGRLRRVQAPPSPPSTTRG